MFHIDQPQIYSVEWGDLRNGLRLWWMDKAGERQLTETHAHGLIVGIPFKPRGHASEARVMLLLAFIPLGYCPPSSGSARERVGSRKMTSVGTGQQRLRGRNRQKRWRGFN
jgi:hypothetical protein